jgi:pyruvate/2-oxoglutarate dehydrogenase complex dihydrolipoamide acyltransferase (E2) component
MALLQEIVVPLLAVNDTSLTVVEMNFTSGQHVKKGDLVMVFETSKTTYEVLTETEGYVQYLCELDQDYEVNEIVAKIFSEEKEVSKVALTPAQKDLSRVEKGSSPLSSATGWEGETLFSAAARSLIESSGISPDVFQKKDFVSTEDVEAFLGITKSEVSTPRPKRLAQENKTKVVLPVDAAKSNTTKLSSNKKREILKCSTVNGPHQYHQHLY